MSQNVHPSEDSRPLVIFQVGPVTCGVPALEVERLVPPPDALTKVPGAPASIVGLFAYHSEIVAAISLRVKFGLPKRVNLRSGCMLIVPINAGRAAFWVDTVVDVTTPSGHRWTAVPPLIPRTLFDRILLCNDEIILHTDVERLLAAPDSAPALWAAASALPARKEGVLQRDEVLEGKAIAAAAAESPLSGEAGAVLAEPSPDGRESDSTSSPTVEVIPRVLVAEPTPEAAAEEPIVGQETAVAARSAESAREARQSAGGEDPTARGRRMAPLHEASAPLTVADEPPPPPEPVVPWFPVAEEPESKDGRSGAAWRVIAGVATTLLILAGALWIGSSSPVTHEPGRRRGVRRPHPPVVLAPEAVPLPAREPPGAARSGQGPEARGGRVQARAVLHIVKKGDTLWDISAHYLRDPFRYPELARWSRIEDPHWIYPGDSVRLYITP